MICLLLNLCQQTSWANTAYITKSETKKEHAPLLILSDPHDSEYKSDSLQYVLHDMSIAEWSPTIIVNATILKRLLTKYNSSTKDQYLKHILRIYTVSYIKTGSLLLLIPHWLTTSLNAKNCFNPEAFTLLCKTAEEIVSQLNKADQFPKNRALDYQVNKKFDDQFLIGIKKILKTTNKSAPVWDIWIHGHGYQNSSITGLLKESFDKLISFFSKEISISSLMLESCYIGGNNSNFINRQLKNHNASFNVFLASIGETPSYVSSINKDLSYTSNRWQDPLLNREFTSLIQDYFSDVTQIDRVEQHYNSPEKLPKEKLVENKTFESLCKTLFKRTKFGHGSVQKSEYAPFFKLAESDRFKTVKNMPGFFTLKKELEQAIIKVPSETHTLLLETNNINRLQIVPVKQKTEEVNREITQNLRSFFNRTIPSYFYPSWISLMNNNQIINIGDINLDTETETGIHNFFGSFLTTNISDFKILIERLTGRNDIREANMTRSVKNLFSGNSNLVLTNVTISREIDSEEINCSFNLDERQVYLNLNGSNYQYRTY